MSIIRTVAAFCLLILICNATINAQQCNLNSQGSFCTSLQLSIDCQDATQIQWFRNDELIPGWSDSSIELRDITDEQGDYHAEYFLNGVAGATTAVQVRNIFYETDLGDMFICKGDTLLIPNFPPLAHSGQYQTRTTAQDGCDSLIFFTLSALPETITNLGTQYICNSEVFTYGGIEYNQPGEYDVFIGSTIYGCDSTVTFQVVKDSAIRVDLPVIKLCYGDSIIIDGETYNEDTLFTKTILSPTTGCDSITSYSIRVQPEIITNLGQKQICNGEVFNYRGIEYNQPGEYQINISSTTIHACDTTVIFQVVKDSAIRVALPIIELCFGDSIIIDGQIYYDDAQIEKNAISTTTGCDSITIST